MDPVSHHALVGPAKVGEAGGPVGHGGDQGGGGVARAFHVVVGGGGGVEAAVPAFPLPLPLPRGRHQAGRGRRPLVRQQGPSPEVHVGGHGLEDVAEHVGAGEDAAGRLAVVLRLVVFAARGPRAVAGGGASAGRTPVLALAMVAFQVVLEAG